MLTDEQVQWVVPVFKEGGAILDKIPDFSSNDCYHEECLNNLLNDFPGDYEFFFVEDIGLYKLIDHERGQLFQEVYGRTKREIIKHIADKYVGDDAYLRYAAHKFRKMYPNCPLPCFPNDVGYDQYQTFAKERLSYCHSIIEPYINSFEDIAFPPTPEEPLKLLKQGKYISLFSKGNKRIVKVILPDIHKYYRSSCFLDVLHEEEGYQYGATCEIHERENSTINISRFFEEAGFLTLRVEILRDNKKIDSQIMERLDIDT